jgi:hypothetical protein
MSAGFILQYESQQLVVGFLVKRAPTQLLIDPTMIGLWVFGALGMLIENEALTILYWITYFLTLLAFILRFDYHVIANLSRELDLPIFSIRQKVDDELVTLRIEEEIEDIGTDPTQPDGANLVSPDQIE